MSDELKQFFIDRLNLDLLSGDTQIHFFDVMSRYMAHGRTDDFIVNSLDRLLEFFDAIGINRIESVIILSNDPAILNNVKDLYNKFIFLGIIENEDNTFRKHKFFSKTKDYRVALDTMYTRYQICLYCGYDDIKWNTIVHATDSEFAKIFLPGKYKKDYRVFDTVEELFVKYAELHVDTDKIDLSEFKLLKVNEEAARKYEGKRRAM